MGGDIEYWVAKASQEGNPIKNRVAAVLIKHDSVVLEGLYIVENALGELGIAVAQDANFMVNVL